MPTLHSRTHQGLTTIAGKSAGKQIVCVDTLLPAFEQLLSAAQKGHYWPLRAVKELTALSSGMPGKSNVYIRQSKSNEYTVFLPALKATIERWPNDQYCITGLVLDAHYFEATATGDPMGLYRAKPAKEGWKTKHVEDGRIEPKNDRVVTVADTGYRDASRAATEAVPRAAQAPGVSTAKLRRGCDLHFTPGKKRLGSLIRYNALANDDARSSAVHLAHTMKQARGVEGVAWVADHGGSVVLTQAMQVLADQGITLESHTAYLAKADSSPGQAVRLAHKLKMDVDDAFASTGMDLRGAASKMLSAGARLEAENDTYTKLHATKDWFTGTLQVSGAVGAGVFLATSAGVASPLLAAMGAVVGALGTTKTMLSVGQSVTGSVRHKLKR